MAYTAKNITQLRAILEPVMDAIAATIGSRCEVVLHDLSYLESTGNTIVAIRNGHVTGRSVGGPTTSLGLERRADDEVVPNRFDYRTKLPDGRVLRSSSVYFPGPSGKLIAALCINFDITEFTSAETALESLVGGMPPSPENETSSEIFGTHIDEVLDGIIAKALRELGRLPGQLGRADRVRVIDSLDRSGALTVKRSIARVAATLEVSRATVYSCLEEARAARADGQGKSLLASRDGATARGGSNRRH